MARRFCIDVDEPGLMLLICALEQAAGGMTRFLHAHPADPQAPAYREDIRAAEALLLVFSRSLAGRASGGLPVSRGSAVFN